MVTKRKAVLLLRLYERGSRGDEWLEGRLIPLNEAIPERGFEDAEFIPNLPNRLVVELIWPKIIKDKDKNSKEPIKEALKMRFVSKFWLRFVDHSDVMLDQNCKFILKCTVAERAAAPGWFRNWRHCILL